MQELEHALRDDLVELKREDRRVDGDAPEDLEEHGGIAPGDERPPEMRPEADVEEEPRHDEQIAEQRREERAARDDAVFLILEPADEQRRRVAAARERDAAEHVERDPEPPGRLIREMRDVLKARQKARDRHAAHEGDEREQHEARGRDREIPAEDAVAAIHLRQLDLHILPSPSSFFSGGRFAFFSLR